MENLDILLMVEDEEAHGELILRALKKQGNILNEIYWARDGQEALDFVREGEYRGEKVPRPGLILLDVRLPMVDGFDVLKELKADDRFKAIPIVMLTTTARPDDISRALELGANDYIVKPVGFCEFVQKVGNVGRYWAFTSDSRSC
jgi:two-component system, response regulator